MGDMVPGEDYYMEDAAITEKGRKMLRLIRYLRIISSTTTRGK